MDGASRDRGRELVERGRERWGGGVCKREGERDGGSVKERKRVRERWGDL